jgi:hypothetical protein
MGGVAKAVGLGGPNYLENRGPFGMTSGARAGEKELIERLRAQASGQGPSITGLQYQQAIGDIAKQQQSAAASARGVSNAGLLARQAMMGGQQAGVDLANQVAAAKLQEQRTADQMMANIASGQRGTAVQSAVYNQQAQGQSQDKMANFLGNAATSYTKFMMPGGAAGGSAQAAYGAEVPGEPIVEGDSPINDTKDYKLSPGEIVIPRSAAKDRESAMAFLDALKFDQEKKKPKKEESELKEPAKEQETDFHAMAKGMAALLQSMAEQHKKK